MRVLVAIANYGTGNRHYLDRLIAEYHSMPWEVDVVVLSNIPKALDSRVEVRVGLPDKNPWSLPFAHRALFAERRNDYDLFIYSEDDTLVRARNIEAFLETTEVLGANEIATFMRTETDSQGNLHVSTMHGCFRWVTAAAIERSGQVFTTFSNTHSAVSMATRRQLDRAIASGGFLVAPHQWRHDLLVSAATDLYTQCGLKAYVPVSRLEDFLLPHLPNKYLGRMGVPLVEVKEQIETLKRIAAHDGWRGPLFDVETGKRHHEYSKDLYEYPDPDLRRMIPAGTRTVLSVGCGWGATEAELARMGIDVTAIPVDPVFGDSVRRHGIRTIEGPLPEAVGRIARERFDCILLNDVLHLVDDPIAWLAVLRPLLEKDRGALVVAAQNTADVVTRLKAFTTTPPDHAEVRQDLGSVGVRRVKSWLRAAGFVTAEVQPFLTPKRERAAKAALGAFRDVLAHRFLVRASVQ